MQEGTAFILISKPSGNFVLWDEMNQERLGEYSPDKVIEKITEMIHK